MCIRDSFLTEYVSGQELFDIIRDIGLLSTYDAQFAIGSIILAIEYLHSENIIYRDLKPENIMVDEQGYIKLIDMGTAKILSPSNLRTYTIIGTPHYIAPEVLKGKGYTTAVDLWAIGVCLFEFMCGYLPFGDEADDPMEIYESVSKAKVIFPLYLQDQAAKSLILQLLSKIPEQRLGPSYAALKANPWFANFSWEKLLEKELVSPFQIPQQSLVSQEMIEEKFQEGRTVAEELEEEDYIIPSESESKKREWDPKWDEVF
eukprot:TRINITY_DN12783_c0_g2_i2.p1 TRINITY_DN12783_c0_g2~~TRINITY_DN12783_c0_g2_i2.p1  ORF type:complete len:279 (-),score=86.05 TRINITY_DN12783_c0_g2_i2:169-948(-)